DSKIMTLEFMLCVCVCVSVCFCVCVCVCVCVFVGGDGGGSRKASWLSLETLPSCGSPQPHEAEERHSARPRKAPEEEEEGRKKHLYLCDADAVSSLSRR